MVRVRSYEVQSTSELKNLGESLDDNSPRIIDFVKDEL